VHEKGRDIAAVKPLAQGGLWVNGTFLLEFSAAVQTQNTPWRNSCRFARLVANPAGEPLFLTNYPNGSPNV
jgi:hypothetical protein